MKKQKFGKIGWQDAVKSLILAFLIAFLQSILVIFDSHELPTWPQVLSSLKIALAGSVGYLIKNLLTNSRDQFMKMEPKTKDS